MQNDARSSRLGPSNVRLARRADGSMIVRSPHELGDYPRAMTDLLDRWADERPEHTFLAQREGSGWRKLTYAVARAAGRNIGQALLDRGLSAEHPVAILSGNGIDHALIGLGAMYVGVPFASISPAYSLMSSDFKKLREIVALLTPGLVFAVNGKPFAGAITAAVAPETELVLSQGPLDGRRHTVFSDFAATPASRAVDEANAKLSSDSIAKFLFTSGSTGSPKAVINTQRMLCSNQVMMQKAYPSVTLSPPVIVDWLPWSHTFGGNHNVGLVLMNGGTMYIDDGRPMPGAIEETVRNLREIACTAYYNVPKGFEMLLPFLRAEPALRKKFFSNLQFLFFAGAALPLHLWEELERMGIETTGARVPMLTSLGSTETAPSALSVTPKSNSIGVVGIPNVGVEMKLVPTAGKLEARIKGPLVTPGYWRQPELTRKAFDGEGYYLLGDALKFANPEDAERGFIFDGRVAEDFKLTSGTWVSVGPLRNRFISHFAPLVRDVVIAGHDRDFVSGLMIPDLDACRALLKGKESTSPLDVISNPTVRAKFQGLLDQFNAGATGGSHVLKRLVIMHAPPSIDLGEITDKGTINQHTVLANRREVVEQLYAPHPGEGVVCWGESKAGVVDSKPGLAPRRGLLGFFRRHAGGAQ